MDAEKLKEAWWSPSSSLEWEEWVEISRKTPSPFWKSLLSFQKELSPLPPQSELGKKYDFYSDLVLRHSESNLAITYIDENGFVENWTYKKLHRTVNFVIKQWAQYELKPGQIVALILPVGIDFFVALLAALRLGLTISYLASDSPYLSSPFLSSLVDQLEPTWVITGEKEGPPPLDKYRKLPLKNLEECEQVNGPSSYAYDPMHFMQHSLSLHSSPPFSIVSLDAQTTYLHALREGLITLGLQPGVTWTSPLTCPLRTQPCSTLMTFLSGATLLHIEEKAIENDPSILKNEKIHLLGISPRLQKLGGKKPLSIGKHLKGYYKPPLSHHPSSWKTFVQMNKLEKIPSFKLLIDNVSGGALFFSKPSLEEMNPFFKPTPPLSWSLADLTGNQGAPLNGMGIFSYGDQPIETHFIVAQIENNLLLSGTVKPSIEGIAIPIEKIESTVSQLPFVEHCLLHCALKMGETTTYRTSLLLFIHPLKNHIGEKTKSEWVESIKTQISKEIGTAFLPDQIEFYPLIPPLKEGRIDRARCAEQFKQGHLHRKRASQVYQLINILKKMAQENSSKKG